MIVTRERAESTPLAVQPASFATAFSAALRRAGLSVAPERTGWLTRALRLVPPDSREALYSACRTVLVSSRVQLPVFDAVFSAVFDGRLDPADARGDPNAPPAIGSEARTRPTAPDARPGSSAPDELGAQSPAPSTPGDDGGDDEPVRETLLAVASNQERLHDTSFAELSEEEIAQIRHLIRKIVIAAPVRTSRRSHPRSRTSPRLDLRRTIRAAHKTGTEAVRLSFAHRRTRPRPLVLLCDVSGSMEPYTRVLLTLMQSAVVSAQAEAFVFSTRLTRLTRPLMVRNPDQALERAAAAAPDWAGGTRLAASIRQFIDFGRRGIARGAVVVVISDGWAQDSPEEVSAQMARLQRLAHRIIWVNPRKVAQGYQPLVGGMAAALPYCDAFLSGHSYRALEQLAEAIGDNRAPSRHQPSSPPRTSPETDQ